MEQAYLVINGLYENNNHCFCAVPISAGWIELQKTRINVLKDLVDLAQATFYDEGPVFFRLPVHWGEQMYDDHGRATDYDEGYLPVVTVVDAEIKKLLELVAMPDDPDEVETYANNLQVTHLDFSKTHLVQLGAEIDKDTFSRPTIHIWPNDGCIQFYLDVNPEYNYYCETADFRLADIEKAYEETL